MRISYGFGNIAEISNLEIMPCGFNDPNHPGQMINIECYLNVIEPDGEDVPVGEFDVTGCKTFEEAYEVARPFYEDMLRNGFVDISTEKMRKHYKLTIY